MPRPVPVQHCVTCVVGDVLETVLAIAVGAWLGTALSANVPKYGAATLSFVFGAVLLWQGIQAL